MKILNAIILNLFLITGAYASTENCYDFGYSFMNEINALFNNKCAFEVGKEDKYCACLALKKDDLTESLRTQSEFQKKLEEQQEILRNRLMNTYALVNYDSRLQEQAYGLKKGARDETSCTSKRFADEFYGSYCLTMKDAPECLQLDEVRGGNAIQIAKNLSECSGDDCNSVYKMINEKFKQKMQQIAVKNSQKEKAVEGKVSLINGAEQVWEESTGIGAKIGVIHKYVGSCTSTGCTDKNVNTLTEEERFDLAAHKKSIEEMLEFFEKYSKFDEGGKHVQRLEQILKSKKFDDPAIEMIKAEYNYKLSFAPRSSKDKDEVRNPYKRDLAKAMESMEKKISNKMKENFSKSQPDACIPYDQYKILNSVPKDELLNSWMKMDDKQIAASLDPKNLGNSSSPTLDFLKANPLLAKLVVTPKSRQDFATKLKGFSQKLSGKSKADKLKEFISFMKNDISSAVEDSKINNIYQCELLARNMAAVYSSPSMPGMAKPQGGDGIEALSSDLLACQVHEKNAEAGHDIDEVLSVNQLYTILGRNSISPEKLGPENDEGYKEFNRNQCQGFADFRKAHVKDFCSNIFRIAKKVCERKFLSVEKSRSKKMLREFYKTKNGELGELVSIIDQNIEETDIDDVKDSLQEENQDQQAAQVYDSQVRPHISGGLFDTPSSSPTSSSEVVERVLAHAQDTYNQSYGSGVNSAPSIANQEPLAPAPSRGPAGNSEGNGLSEGAVVNPGQVMPDFFNQPALPGQVSEVQKQIPSKITSLDDVDKVVKNIEEYKPEEQDKIVEEAQDFLERHNGNQKKIAELQKQLDEIEDIKDAKKESGEAPAPVRQVAGNVPFKSQIPSNQNISNYSTGSIGKNISNSGSSNFGSGSMTKTADKAAISYQKALNQMNDRVSADQIVMSSPVGASELGGKFVTVDAALEISQEKYEEITKSKTGEELKAYLGQNMANLPANGVISIKCRVGCAPNSNEILVKLERGIDNKLVIRGIKSETPVVSRVHLRSNLLNEFKATK